MDLSLFYLPTYRKGFAASLNAYYEEMAASVRLADELGWARALTTEHHFHYYGGAVPNPALIMAGWARETKRIRLGAAVSLVPLRNPLMVAEDYALLDQLSGGRFDMGIARGFVPHEFDAFGIPQEETTERIAEALEVIQAFWAGEPFAHKGRFFTFDRLEPWPVPVQKKIPIWNAASNSRESFDNAGRRGFHLMMNQYPMTFESLAEKHGWYCDAYATAGHDPAKRKSMVAFMTYIADTEEDAIARAKAALQEHAGAFGKLMQGDQWNRDYEADESVLLRMCEGNDVRDVFRKRTLICTAEQAAERLAPYRELGFTEVSFVPRFGNLSAAQCTESIHRLTEEVRPQLAS